MNICFFPLPEGLAHFSKEVYWNDSTIIIERKAKLDNWIINAFDNKLKYRNNDTVVGPVSTSYIKRLQSKTGLCGTVVGPVSTSYINERYKKIVEN